MCGSLSSREESTETVTKADEVAFLDALFAAIFDTDEDEVETSVVSSYEMEMNFDVSGLTEEQREAIDVTFRQRAKDLLDQTKADIAAIRAAGLDNPEDGESV